ncbi:hypothetical protein AQUCO_10800027v1 [Aquilegia coerulea]|uniref:Outer envelope pore protein 37, chloroplastic n=1 Tax=Aquilegia coerulea TaxID=218851 RepID=A0A2G5C381_AQUCA|nr:hypothetical protein AQUCO_10800027v1 [Aquilegia coerulea]
MEETSTTTTTTTTTIATTQNPNNTNNNSQLVLESPIQNPNNNKSTTTRSFFSFPSRPPPVRVTSEFDSDSNIFLHKVSCKLFNSIAKLKLSFQNNKEGGVSDPQIAFVTKHLSIFYDVEEQNAFVKGSFGILGDRLQFRAAQDVKRYQHGEPNYIFLGYSSKYFGTSCTFNDWKSIISTINLGTFFQFKYCYQKAQEGEVAMIASLPDPSYKLELSSAVPSIGLPKATFRFPLGEISVEEREQEEEDLRRVLSVSGIVKGQLLNGICAAQYKDENLNLRYSYKDEEMTFIPSISLPSNSLSFAFKRRLGISDKLSYWYNFDSNNWSTVYKHTMSKDFKFKAGYDSDVRLGWASLWVGDEEGKAKTAPMKMKVQVMLQVPQDDIKSSAVMLRVKKRWDF